LVRINWKEFKEYKKSSSREDNFEILLDFMKSYYNMTSPNEVFNSLNVDELAKMMFDKRNIQDAEDLENYLFKL